MHPANTPVTCLVNPSLTPQTPTSDENTSHFAASALCPVKRLNKIGVGSWECQTSYNSVLVALLVKSLTASLILGFKYLETKSRGRLSIPLSLNSGIILQEESSLILSTYENRDSPCFSTIGLHEMLLGVRTCKVSQDVREEELPGELRWHLCLSECCLHVCGLNTSHASVGTTVKTEDKQNRPLDNDLPACLSWEIFVRTSYPHWLPSSSRCALFHFHGFSFLRVFLCPDKFPEDSTYFLALRQDVYVY